MADEIVTWGQEVEYLTGTGRTEAYIEQRPGEFVALIDGADSAPVTVDQLIGAGPHAS